MLERVSGQTIPTILPGILAAGGHWSVQAVVLALKLKAAFTDRSVSDMVNEAVRFALAEDAEDLAALESRANEPEVDFESFLESLKRRGQI